MNTIKKIILASFIIAGATGLSGCQLGVISIDVGIGFESGAFVVSQ